MSQKSKLKDDDEWEILSPEDDEWEIIKDEESNLDDLFPPPKPGVFNKFIDTASTPLSGDFFTRHAREAGLAKEREEESQAWFKPTGRGDLQDKLANASAMWRGFKSGATEGVGNVLDNMTAPADLVAMGTGFGALSSAARGVRGLQTANRLRKISQAASAPIAIHGGQTVLDSDRPWGERAFGLAELAGGLAGMHFPKTALSARAAKGEAARAAKNNSAFAQPKPEGWTPKSRLTNKEFPDDLPLRNEGDPNLNQGIGDPELAGSTPYKAAADQPAIGEIVDIGGREMVVAGFDARGKPKLELPKKATPEPIVNPETESSVDRLFPGMKRRDTGWKPVLDDNVDTSSSFSDRAKRVFGDETGAIGDDLGPPRRVGDSIDDLSDIDRGVGRRFPGDEAFDLTQEARLWSPDDLVPDTRTGEAAPILQKDRGVSPEMIARIRKQQPQSVLPAEFAPVADEVLPARGSDLFRNDSNWMPEQLDDLVTEATSKGINPSKFRTADELQDAIDAFDLSQPGARSFGDDVFDTGNTIDINQPLVKPEAPSRGRFGILSNEKGAVGKDIEIDPIPNKIFRGLQKVEDFIDDLGSEMQYPELQGRVKRPINAELFPKKTVKADSLRGRFERLLQNEEGVIRFGDESIDDNTFSRMGERIEAARSETPKESKFKRLPSEEQLDPNIPIKERTIQEYPEPSKTQEVWNLARGTMSVDLPFITSAAFRQASPLAWTKGWFKAWGDAAKSFGDETAYKVIMKDIMESEYFKPRYKPKYNTKGEIVEYKEMPSIAEEFGVRMSDVAHLSTREERIMSTLAEKLPLGWGRYNRASNRAYTGFLNSLRKAQLEKMMEQAKFAGVENDLVIGKQIGDFINDATGRSTLKTTVFGKEFNYEKGAAKLANVLWSPRLLASRLRMLNPETYIKLDPMVRKERLHGLMRTAGTWWGFAGLAKMMGAEVGLDPSSSDFGKIKIGDTRIDPGAGFQQFLVFGARMLPENDIVGGKFTSSSTDRVTRYGEGFKGRTRRTTAEEFAASKLHPMARLVYDLLSVSPERPVHLGDRAVQMAIPLAVQDVLEIMQEDPELALIMAPLASAGFGSNTYGRNDKFGDPLFTDSIENFLDVKPKSLRGTVSKW